MSRWTFLGDAHGVFPELDSRVIEAQDEYGPADYVVQVGDFGFYPETPDRPEVDPEALGEKLFIRGNHEDHSMLPLNATEPEPVGYGQWKYVPDAWFHPDGVLFIGGAYSIDRAYRQYGPYRFHHNEQLSLRQEYEIYEKVRQLAGKIKVVVTHDCPLAVYEELFGERLAKACIENTQARFLTHIWHAISMPTMTDRLTWIFGHHHEHVDRTLFDTRFVCLDLIHNVRTRVAPNCYSVHRSPIEQCSISLDL